MRLAHQGITADEAWYMAEKMSAPRHALPCKVAMMTMQTTLSGLRICKCQHILGVAQRHCTYDRYASLRC